jgi:hypothetical protein
MAMQNDELTTLYERAKLSGGAGAVPSSTPLVNPQLPGTPTVQTPTPTPTPPAQTYQDPGYQQPIDIGMWNQQQSQAPNTDAQATSPSGMTASTNPYSLSAFGPSSNLIGQQINFNPSTGGLNDQLTNYWQQIMQQSMGGVDAQTVGGSNPYAGQIEGLIGQMGNMDFGGGQLAGFGDQIQGLLSGGSPLDQLSGSISQLLNGGSSLEGRLGSQADQLLQGGAGSYGGRIEDLIGRMQGGGTMAPLLEQRAQELLGGGGLYDSELNSALEAEAMKLLSGEGLDRTGIIQGRIDAQQPLIQERNAQQMDDMTATNTALGLAGSGLFTSRNADLGRQQQMDAQTLANMIIAEESGKEIDDRFRAGQQGLSTSNLLGNQAMQGLQMGQSLAGQLESQTMNRMGMEGNLLGQLSNMELQRLGMGGQFAQSIAGDELNRMGMGANMAQMQAGDQLNRVGQAGNLASMMDNMKLSQQSMQMGSLGQQAGLYGSLGQDSLQRDMFNAQQQQSAQSQGFGNMLNSLQMGSGLSGQQFGQDLTQAQFMQSERDYQNLLSNQATSAEQQALSMLGPLMGDPSQGNALLTDTQQNVSQQYGANAGMTNAANADLINAIIQGGMSGGFSNGGYPQQPQQQQQPGGMDPLAQQAIEMLFNQPQNQVPNQLPNTQAWDEPNFADVPAEYAR